MSGVGDGPQTNTDLVSAKDHEKPGTNSLPKTEMILIRLQKKKTILQKHFLNRHANSWKKCAYKNYAKLYLVL